MKSLRIWMYAAAIITLGPVCAYAQKPSSETCSRPSAGSTVTQPKNLQSEDGVLRVELNYRNYLGPDGRTRYCYVPARRKRSAHVAT